MKDKIRILIYDKNPKNVFLYFWNETSSAKRLFVKTVTSGGTTDIKRIGSISLIRHGSKFFSTEPSFAHLEMFNSFYIEAVKRV